MTEERKIEQETTDDLLQKPPGRSAEQDERDSKVVTYVLALLSENPNIENFAIYVNLDKILRFNNFIIKAWLKDEPHPHAYLGEEMQFEEEPEKWRSDIIEIIRNKNEIGILEDIPDSNIYFWFYSNEFVAENVKIFEIGKDTSWKSIFSFKETHPYKIVAKHLSEQENLLNKLYFLLNMTSDETIESDIGDILGLTPESTKIIIKYVGLCFSTAQNNILTKYNFEAELLRIHLSKFIVKPTNIVEVNPEQARLWNRLTTEHDITLIDDVQDIQYIVFGCFLQRIIDISKETFKWNDYMLNQGKISKDFNVQMLLKFLKRKAEIQYGFSIPDNIEYLLETMWKCDYLPMVLRSEAELPFLERYKYLKKKFIIIIGKAKNHWSAIDDKDRKVFTNVGDICDSTLKDRILDEILVSLQGREPARLHDIVGNDLNTMKELSCALILHLIKKRRTYLRKECLEEVELMIAIVQDDGSEEVTSMVKINGSFFPNIVIKCKSIYAEAYVKLMKEGGRFENYSVFQLENGKHLLYLSGNRHKVRNYLIDQDGNEVYDSEKYQSIPVIGNRLGNNTQGYINRHLRKATLKKTLLTKPEKQICLMCGDIESLEMSIRKFIIKMSDNFENEIESHLQMDKPVMIDVRGLPLEDYWSKFSSENWPLFHVQVVDSSLQLLNCKNCPNMSSYITYGGEIFDERQFFEEITSKVVIISGETGIGKSLMLQELSTIYDKSSYVLFYNFPDYREDFLQYAPNLFRNPLGFIFEQYETDPSRGLLQSICNYHENIGRLILFIDSLDRLLPFYAPFVLGIIECLARTNVRIVLAARPISRSMLVDNLEIVPVRINYLKKEDIKDYLKSKGMINVNLEKMPLEFLSNPLFLDCVQSLYRKDCKHQVTYDKFELYKTVALRIVERHYHQAITDQFCRDTYVKQHRLLALVALFGKKIISDKEIIKDYNAFVEEFRNSAEIQLGFVREFRDNYPIFLHQIFSEFLAMDWLNENLTTEKSAKIIYNNMMFKHVNIRYLFDRMICKNLPLHNAVLRKDYKTIRSFCEEDENHLEKVDKCGRTPLLLVCSYCFDNRHYPSLEVIVEYMTKKKLDFTARDQLMNWDWIQYLNFSNNRFLAQAYNHGLTTTIQVFLKHNKKKVASEDISSALNNNHLDTALVLFRNNPALLPDHFHKTARIAIDQGRMDILTSLLKIQYSSNIAYRIVDKACRNKIFFTSIAKYVRMRTKDGFTALHVACMYGNADVAIKLLCVEADLYATDNFEKIPLHYAVIQGSIEVVSALIKRMITVNYVDDVGNGPLYFASKFAHAGIVKFLLKYGLYNGATNLHGYTALHIAAEKGHVDIVQMLLDSGANAAQKDKRGNTALHLACLHESIPVVQCLMKHSDDIVSNKNIIGLTAFDIACLERKHDIVEYFLTKTRIGSSEILRNALCTMVKQGELTTMAVLIDRKLIDKSQLETIVGECGRTLLHLATMHGHTNVVRFLLGEEVKVNPLDDEGCTPLHFARNISIAKLLLKKYRRNSEVHARSSKGETPLHVATRSGHVDIIKLLLSEKAQISSKDSFGWTPLHRAVVSSVVDIANILIKHGADVNEQDDELRTPLHLVFQRDPQYRRNLPVQSSALDLLSLLLKNGADPKMKDKNGDTALHLALKKWDGAATSLPFVEILLKHGADPCIVNNDNKSAKDLGEQFDLNDIWYEASVKMQ